MSISMEQMEEVLESFSDHNVERIVSHFEEEGEFLMAAGPEPHGERFVGREAIGEVLRQRFAAVPDIRWAGVKTWVCGDLRRDRVARPRHDSTRSPGLSRL